MESQSVENASRSVGARFSSIRRLGVVLAVGCFGLAVSGSASAEGCVPESAPAGCTYPLDITTTTTVVGNEPPVPTITTTTLVEVRSPLPKTGSSGVGDSLMVGGTVALSGLGLVIVSRRRRRVLGTV